MKQLKRFAPILGTLAVLTALIAARPEVARTAVVKQQFNINKPGVGKVSIEGRKDTVSTATPPPKYRDTFDTSTGTKQDRDKIEHTIRLSLKLERDAMRSDNRDKGPDFKKRFSEVFSSTTGELDKRRSYIDTNNGMSDGSGVVVLSSAATRVDVQQVLVSGSDATAVVDVLEQTVYRQTRENDRSKSDVTATDGTQHTFTLRLEDGIWKITGDRSTLMPGYTSN